MHSVEKENMKPRLVLGAHADLKMVAPIAAIKSSMAAAAHTPNAALQKPSSASSIESKPRRTPLANLQQHPAVVQTPRSGARASSRRVCWKGDLDAYLEARNRDAPLDARERDTLVAMASKVKTEPTCADSWWTFLCSMEEQKGLQEGEERLDRLFEWATKLVPRQGNKNNEAYVNLWLGFIKRQKNEEDIRDTFKMLRNMGIGEKCTRLYEEWALFERASGNAEKAKGIIKKGIQAGALPKEAMDKFVSAYLTQPTEDHSRATIMYTPKHQQQSELTNMAVKMYGGCDDEEMSISTCSRTASTVLASKTFTSVTHSNSSTMHTGTVTANMSMSNSSIAAMSASTTPANSMQQLHTQDNLSSVNLQTVTPAGLSAATSSNPEQSNSGNTKGPKRLGLRKFAGPARRVISGDRQNTEENQQSSARSSVEGFERNSNSSSSMPVLDPPKDSLESKNYSMALPDHYTDISGKLSPIVEASSCSTSSSSQRTGENSSSQRSAGGSNGVSKGDSVNSTPANREGVQRQYATQPPSAAAVAPPPPLQQRQPAPQPQQEKQTYRAPASAGQPQTSAETSSSGGKANNHLISVNGKKYTILECIGKGGSSKVFKVISMTDHKIFALKRIKLQGREQEAASGFMDEITLLNRLTGKDHIIRLVDSEVVRDSGIIYMVLECGEVDLARVLQKREKAKASEGQQNKIDLNFIRLHWQQMLEAVHIIHEERIVHSDLKPANFLFVEGSLKLIDFGIAKAIQNDTTHIARESQVGTLNYMSPEAILSGNGSRSGKQTKVGRASDVWSLGCILYQMVYGHTPFSHLQFIQKLHAITDGSHEIAFPPIQDQSLLDVLKRCLDRSPRTRIGIPELLEHPFLHPSHGGGQAETQLTPELLNSMLTKLTTGGQDPNEISKISEELCRQLTAGNGLCLQSLISKIPKQQGGIPAGSVPTAPPPPPPGTARAPAAPPPPPPGMPPPPPPPKVHKIVITKRKDLSVQNGTQPQHGGELAAAVAAKALARSKQRQEALFALENKKGPKDDDLKMMLAKQQAALKSVDAKHDENEAPTGGVNDKGDTQSAGSGVGADQPGNLEGVLRQGLMRFQNALHQDDTMTMTGDITGSATEDTMSWQ